MRAAGAGRPVTAAADAAAMGADGHFDERGEVGFATAGGKRPTAGLALPLVRRQVCRLVGRGEVRIGAAPVTGASGLLAAATARRLGGGRVVSRGVGQGIGSMMGFATAAIETLFEQAHFRFEFVDALSQFAFALVQAGGPVGLALGQLFVEMGFAPDRALVEGLIVARLLPRLPKRLSAGRETAGGLGGRRVRGAGFHPSQYASCAGQRVGR